MVAITVSLDAVLGDRIDVDKNVLYLPIGPPPDALVSKNIQFMPMGPPADEALVSKNIQFIPLSPPLPVNIDKNIQFIPLQPIRLLRRKYFTSHGE